ncbi:MAG: pyridoxamine 5'-phosphate oxidase [Fodinibius sp.]|nr:pyridoxamine 5'-phosphate oxidase [Fodinibius sp.]
MSDDSKRIAELRRDYSKQELVESEVASNPLDQFITWFEQVLSAELLDANAMTLATATEEGVPSARIVLLKGVDEHGFRFYTNYESRKGQELLQNPRASLCFFWAPLERQVRVEGSVEKLSAGESESYFHRRPRKSQLGAWASKQSSKVESRDELVSRFKKMEERFADREVPLPEFWGGFLLRPQRVEFWQGRQSRMHDRICYEQEGDSWKTYRLAP